MSSQYKNQDCINLILEELEIDANFLPFEEEGLTKYFEKIDNHAAFKKLFSEGQLAGFISFYCNDKNREKSFITMVVVDKNFRGRGIAKELLIEVLACLKSQSFQECSLAVRKYNAKAIGLYKAFGFVETHNDSDSIFMTKRI